MNRRILGAGVVLTLCFGLLFVQLNNIQVRQTKALSKSFLGTASPVHEIYLPRGAIFSADDKILAYTKKVHGVEKRVYPNATAVDFAQLLGYVDTTADAVSYGIEGYYNSYLQEHQGTGHGKMTDNVILTVRTKLQADAASILAGHRGAAIVALDPRTGAILAMDGNPSYNPNVLATLNRKAASKAFAALSKVYPEPFISAATAVTKPPGSTFKVIDTAGIFDHKPSLAHKRFKFATEIHIRGAPTPFHNYAFNRCGGPLAQILAQSCDTAYAEVGLALGARSVVAEAEHFGWCEGLSGTCKKGGTPPPVDLPQGEVAGATMADEKLLSANPPYLAYSSIGQYNDGASVLSMALVAAGIADNGKIMAPHLMRRIIGSDGVVVARYHPHVWKTATSAATAKRVRSLMLGVTETSTGGTAGGVFANLQAQGVQVAAKTGTAEAVVQSSTGNCATDDWLIAMAPAGAGKVPSAVVAAEVPTPNGAADCAEATGATVAGPLVDQMLTDVLTAGR
jgi:peptidoglycan glycosyltransferase